MFDDGKHTFTSHRFSLLFKEMGIVEYQKPAMDEARKEKRVSWSLFDKTTHSALDMENKHGKMLTIHALEMLCTTCMLLMFVHVSRN